MVAKLLVRDIETPVGSPVADALNVPEIVQDDAVVELTAAATTFIDPLKDADAVPLEAVTI